MAWITLQVLVHSNHPSDVRERMSDRGPILSTSAISATRSDQSGTSASRIVGTGSRIAARRAAGNRSVVATTSPGSRAVAEPRDCGADDRPFDGAIFVEA